MNAALEELTELLGYPAAMRLCLHHGGETLYFAKNKEAVLDLPKNKIQLLQERYRGDVLAVPLAKKPLARWLVQEQNISITEAAKLLRTSRSSVNRYLAESNVSQPSLFEGVQ